MTAKDEHPILKNKIKLSSVFGFGLLIGLSTIALFVYSQRKMEVPETFHKPPEKIAVITNISDEFSREFILGHRDNQRAYANIPIPLFDSCRRQSIETYRFSYRDAWLRSAFTLTLTARGEAANAVWQKFFDNREAKRLEYRPPENIPVSLQDWTALKLIIRQTQFLQMPPVDLDENGYPRGGADGDSWTIESCVDGRYHFAYRWTPYGDEYDSFRSVGKAMMKGAGSLYQPVGVEDAE